MAAATDPPTEPVINLSANVGLPPQWSQNSPAREDNQSEADSKSASSKKRTPTKISQNKLNMMDNHLDACACRRESSCSKTDKVIKHKDGSNRQLGEVTEILLSSTDIVQPTLDVCPQKRRVDHNENTGADVKEGQGKPKSPPKNTKLPTAKTPPRIQALVHEVVEEVVHEQNVDIDTSTTGLVTYLSDSSPPPVFTNYEPTQAEIDLASLLLATEDPPKGDLTPNLDNALFAVFEQTLEKHPFV
ncbi:unnamed protein product [Cochlearia groenlandica]